jgi:GPI inositol-deacylase
MPRCASGSSGDSPHVKFSNRSNIGPADDHTSSGLPQHTATVESRGNEEQRPSSARSRRPGNPQWTAPITGNGVDSKTDTIIRTVTTPSLGIGSFNGMEKEKDSKTMARRPRQRSPWAITILTLCVSLTGIGLLGTILNSLVTRQLDPKGCRMSYMRPSYVRLNDFDTEHTRFASKYSLYLYREQSIDDDTKVRGGLCACTLAMTPA